MPNIQSAKKNLRRIAKRRTFNKAVKSKIRTLKKKFLHSLAQLPEQAKGKGKGDESSSAKHSQAPKDILSSFYKEIDKATGKGIFKKNTAARYKSQLSKKLPQSSPAS